MKANIRHIVSAGIASLVLLAACSREDDWTGAPQSCGYLQIEGEIVGAKVAATRVTHLDPLALSYQSFEAGDEIGFFSFHEEGCQSGDDQSSHTHLGDDKDYLKNEKLTYTNVMGSMKFTSNVVENVALNKLGLTFAYYPYTNYAPEDGKDLSKGPEGYVKYVKTSNKESYEKLDGNDYYLNIFRENGTDDIEFEDFLAASKEQYFNINYKFEHQFSMLLLYLGEGFDPETEGNEELTVHLTEKVIGAHLTRGWKGGWPNFTVEVDKVPMSMADQYEYGASQFTARKIDKYILPDTEDEKTVYPIILPPGVEIDYIEVKDISGMKQKVKPTEKAFTDEKGNPTGLLAGKIYPLTIKMTGITPTIYPHAIIDWNVQDPIEVNELPGIYNAGQFADWLELYNQHVSQLQNQNQNLPPGVSEKFESYGEWNVYERTWTFYLRDNIDCSGIVASDSRGALIKELPAGVILDGRNNILNGLELNFEQVTPTDNMIGMIGEINGGTLKNVRVEFVTVRNMKDIPSGCIAAKISRGTVTECTVRNAVMISRDNRQAGVLAGIITGGIVNECKFHGSIQADVREHAEEYKSYKGVAGEIGNGGDLRLSPVINRLIFTEEQPKENE